MFECQRMLKEHSLAAHSQNRRQQKKKGGSQVEGGKDEGFRRGAGYKDIVKENELFVKYYKVVILCISACLPV